eukprot:Sdes_comp19007_c0_seq4m9553
MNEQLAYEMCSQSIDACLVNVDGKILEKSFAGRSYDNQLLEELAEKYPLVDFCAENGEFHTLCLCGPAFSYSIRPLIEFKQVETIQGHFYQEVAARESNHHSEAALS